MTILGVDYANVDHDTTRIFPAAKAAGVGFAIVRGTYETARDPVVVDLEAIRAAGLVAGAYVFPVMAATAPSAAVQMAAFAGVAKLIAGVDLPPVLDVEFPGGIARTGRSRTELLAWIHDAVAALEDTFGARPILYTSGRVWDGTDDDSLAAPPTPDLVGCPVWLARYPFKSRSPAVLDRARVDALPWPQAPRSWGAGNLWAHQYQGDALGVPGFSSTVDLSRWKHAHEGEQGARVGWIRYRLGVVTGKVTAGDTFDHDLELAVADFQHARGLVADGVIGPRTFAALAWG